MLGGCLLFEVCGDRRTFPRRPQPTTAKVTGSDGRRDSTLGFVLLTGVS